MNAMTTIVGISVLGPVIGSLIGVIKKPSEAFMYNMLSFAAGVMLTISFLELIPESIEFSSIYICSLGIVIGSLIMYSIDKLIPHIHPELIKQEQGRNLQKTATYLIVGIFLHNFPEGMAIAIGTVSDSKISIAIALAIAIHNIPEGICTSAPYYHCTKNRLKSFLVSSTTALPILVGFIFANFLFKNISPTLIGLIIGATAGLMIYICADELIPTSCCKTTNHSTIFSLIAGILFVILLQLI
ncbi:ZIP family metal transporter [Wukongibacter sp. M2B1]|uniref:ZIP family metal transporter n=1 Tax=Wukongibacter sp. M2B1 TaxID=3088895 RepID=UPI003D78D714